MDSIRLPTRRLELLLQTVEETMARIDAMSPADREQLSEDWLIRVQQATSPDPWIHGFSITNREDDDVVGECGFKGPPNADGIVEIAYAVHPDHQRRGLGRRIMESLMQQLRLAAPKTAYVSLIADGVARKMYSEFGFTPTAPASIGMALHL